MAVSAGRRMATGSGRPSRGQHLGCTRRRFGLRGFALTFAALAWLGGRSAPAPAAADEIKPPVVFAAASMKTALDAAAEAWKASSGKTVKISYASSAALAKQIAQGAPADIFISADLKWLDYLEKENLIRKETQQNRFGNKLVLIAPADSTIKLDIARGFDLAGAAGDGKIAVCLIESCPAGIYAREALESLGVFAAAEPKLAQAENVRSALSLVAHGEAALGIVYATDARAEPAVKVLDTFPESSHSPIVYPIAMTASSVNPDAVLFLSFLSSQAATKIFRGQGFDILTK